MTQTSDKPAQNAQRARLGRLVRPGRCRPAGGWLLAMVGAIMVLGSWVAAHAIDIDNRPHNSPTPAARAGEHVTGKVSAETNAQTPTNLDRRSPAEVNALIKKAGRTPPKWWGSVELNYPKTLDLVGKVKVEGWKPDIKVGAYMISRVSPNPRRWRGGIKLLHHVLTVQKDDSTRLHQTMAQLGGAYFNFEQDYARAAFWLRKAADPRRPHADNLIKQATCYWRLGNRQMAEQILRRFRDDWTRFGSVIRLRAKMGDFDKAIAMADARAESGAPDSAYLAAGDICRAAGKYEQAADYYRKILALPRGSRWLKNNKLKAQPNLKTVEAYSAIDLAKIPDGTYSGMSPGYRGPIRLAVTVKSGRIERVEVVRHREDLFFTSLVDTPKRIVRKQGINVDVVTGATVTSTAIINATVKALTKAMPEGPNPRSP